MKSGEKSDMAVVSGGVCPVRYVGAGDKKVLAGGVVVRVLGPTGRLRPAWETNR